MQITSEQIASNRTCQQQRPTHTVNAGGCLTVNLISQSFIGTQAPSITNESMPTPPPPLPPSNGLLHKALPQYTVHCNDIFERDSPHYSNNNNSNNIEKINRKYGNMNNHNKNDKQMKCSAFSNQETIVRNSNTVACNGTIKPLLRPKRK